MKLFCNNKLISTDVKFCDGFYKIKGLMFSKKLKNNQCLILNNSSDIHMLFVFQIIDVVWLDKNKIVIDKKENVKPFNSLIRPKRKAYYVLELPLGKAKLFKLGNKIDFR